MAKVYSPLLQGKIQPEIVKLAAPLLLSNFSQQFFYILDGLIVMRCLDEGAFAALGVASTVMSVLTFLLTGSCVGVSLILATQYGANDLKAFRKEMFLACCFGGAFSLSLTWVGLTCLPYFLQWIHTPQQLLSDVSAYLRLIFFGFIATYMFNLAMVHQRAVGRTKITLYLLFLSLALNAILDVLLIYVWPYGLRGAAWASVIAQAVAAVTGFVYIAFKMPQCLCTLADANCDGRLLLSTVRYATVIAIHSSIIYVGKVILQGLINPLGVGAIAAYTAATRLEGVANAVAGSCSDASSVFVAQNTGAGNETRAMRGFRTSMVLIITAGLICAVLIWTTAYPCLKVLLGNVAPENIEQGMGYLRSVAYFYVLCFVCNGFVGFFRGVGDIMTPCYGTFMQISVRVVLTWLWASSWGLAAVGWATGMGWIVLTSYGLWMLHRHNRGYITQNWRVWLRHCQALWTHTHMWLHGRV